MTSFVPPLSFLSHLLGWTESPLSRSLGWLLHWSPWRHLFPSVSRFSSLALFLSVAAIFLKLYELVTTLFSFLTSSLTFFISSWTRIQHLPRDRPSVSVSICLSTSLPALPLFLNSCLGQKLLGKKKYKKKLKKLYIYSYFQEKKVSVLAFINERQL